MIVDGDGDDDDDDDDDDGGDGGDDAAAGGGGDGGRDDSGEDDHGDCCNDDREDLQEDDDVDYDHIYKQFSAREAAVEALMKASTNQYNITLSHKRLTLHLGPEICVARGLALSIFINHW